MMHPMGRMHITLHMRHSGDIDTRVLREGEFICNTLTGWNFGDGHCHDERLVEAVQERCSYEPGDLVVVFTESQPMFTKKVQYRVIDAALGVVEKGWYHNDDAAHEQPWLPNGLLPHVITWTREGYAAVGRGLPRDPATRDPSTGRSRQGLTGVTSAIVVGAGPNGLAAAALPGPRRACRSRCSRPPTTIGGGTRSSEYLVPGLLHDHCSAVHPLAVASPLFKELQPARDHLACRRGRLRPPARRRHGRRVLPVVRPDGSSARCRRSPLAPDVRTGRRALRRPVRRHLAAGAAGAPPPGDARRSSACAPRCRPRVLGRALEDAAGPGAVDRRRRPRVLAARPSDDERDRVRPHRRRTRSRMGGGRRRIAVDRRCARGRRRSPTAAPSRPVSTSRSVAESAAARPADARRVAAGGARHPR